MYQQTRLSDLSSLGAPGPLPTIIAAWAGADDLLSDLTGKVDARFGYDGTGFWPVLITTPAYDPATQVAVPPSALTIQPETRSYAGTATIRAMTAGEFVAANPVPAEVTRAQGRIQLLRMGLLTQVEQAIMAGTDAELKIWWADAATWKRASAYIAALGGVLGLTSLQVDAAFIAAGQIQV